MRISLKLLTNDGHKALEITRFQRTVENKYSLRHLNASLRTENILGRHILLELKSES